MLTGLHPAAIIVTGDELLDGRTRDTNGAFLSEELTREGMQVVRIVVAPDDQPTLARAVRDVVALRPSALVLSGGLGTTHDDVTAAALADVTGRPLTEHRDALAMVSAGARGVAERRHLDFDEVFAASRRQALLPDGARPVPPAGVAPGIALELDSVRVYALPGVPAELRAMWPWVRRDLAAAGLLGDVVTRVLRVYGVGELQVGAVITPMHIEHLEVAVNVGGGEVAVRLRHVRAAAAQDEAVALVAALREAVPVFSLDGRSVDEIVAGELTRRGSTIAVAESCTGGLLGGRLTDLAGSSGYFRGAVVAYANDVKVDALGVDDALIARHGAASAEVSSAMAEGVRQRLEATYGLATTGIAGPDGGTPDKPVGTVWLTCVGPDSVRTVRERFPGDRATVREWAVTRALHLLRETLVA